MSEVKQVGGRGHRLGGRRGRGRGGEALLVKNKLWKNPVTLAAWSLVSEPDNKLLKVHEVQTPHNNTLMSWLCPVLRKAPGPLSGGEGRGMSQPALQWEEHRQASPESCGSGQAAQPGLLN